MAREPVCVGDIVLCFPRRVEGQRARISRSPQCVGDLVCGDVEGRRHGHAVQRGCQVEHHKEVQAAEAFHQSVVGGNAAHDPFAEESLPERVSSCQELAWSIRPPPHGLVPRIEQWGRRIDGIFVQLRVQIVRIQIADPAAPFAPHGVVLADVPCAALHENVVIEMEKNILQRTTLGQGGECFRNRLVVAEDAGGQVIGGCQACLVHQCEVAVGHSVLS